MIYRTTNRKVGDEASVDFSRDGNTPYDIMTTDYELLARLKKSKKRADVIKGFLIGLVATIGIGTGIIGYDRLYSSRKDLKVQTVTYDNTSFLEEEIAVPNTEMSHDEQEKLKDDLYKRGLTDEKIRSVVPIPTEDKGYFNNGDALEGTVKRVSVECDCGGLEEVVEETLLKDLKISQKGIDFIKNHESEGGKFNARKYKCPTGHWTIGYGHKLLPGENYKVITGEEAEEILRNDILKAQSIVDRKVKVPLTQDQYDAAVSFAFNLPKAFASEKNSTFLRELNAGNYDVAAEEMKRWNKGDVRRKVGEKMVVKKETFPGLETRRNEESQMFFGNIRN